jgi:hypothetical protein
MRYTLITDDAGKLLGGVKGDALSEKKGDVEAVLVAGPGQRLQHVEVGDDMANITDANELHKKLSAHLHKH